MSDIHTANNDFLFDKKASSGIYRGEAGLADRDVPAARAAMSSADSGLWLSLIRYGIETRSLSQ